MGKNKREGGGGSRERATQGVNDEDNARDCGKVKGLGHIWSFTFGGGDASANSAKASSI